MRKIPTIYERDENDRAHVLPVWHPDALWVRDGEGVATRKYDGTCVMYDGSAWWARREVKAGKPAPHGFQPLGTDEVTGKTMGWEPIEQSSFFQFWAEAVSAYERQDWEPKTYELCGPKINGNPENLPRHDLLEHGYLIEAAAPRDYDGLHAFLAEYIGEGLVWHHPDGRMAKIKRRDFPRPARDLPVPPEPESTP